MPLNKSKPVYSPLQADLTGRHHLLLGSAGGGVALHRVLRELRTASPGLHHRTQVLIAGSSPDPLPSGNGAAAGVHTFDGIAELLAAFRARLESALMGTRLYIAGPENFIGRVLQVALPFNLNKDEIRAEALGTLARRVHCIHCRAVTEDVSTNLVCCPGCSRWLLVRDHYSRRFAAYMGVMADAEAPGELPPVQETYP